jgi:hypothetical protein
MSIVNQAVSEYLNYTTKTSVLYTELLREISLHLQAWNDQIISSDDLANAIEEIYTIHYSKTLV